MKKFLLLDKTTIPTITPKEKGIVESSYNILISSIKELDGGVMNRVYLINGSLVLKKMNLVYSERKLFDAISFQHELSNKLDSIAKLVLSNMGNLFVKIDKYNFYLTEFQGGRKPNGGDIDRIIESLNAIHKSNFHFSFAGKVDPFKKISADLQFLSSKVKEFGDVYKIDTSSLTNVIESNYNSNIYEKNNSKCVSLHGDPNLMNVIVGDTTLKFIDFDRANSGDSLEDWGRLLCSIMLIEDNNDFGIPTDKRSYNLSLYKNAVNVMKRLGIVESELELLEFLRYCSLYTLRRGGWEIVQASGIATQSSFEQKTNNLLNKYMQLKLI